MSYYMGIDVGTSSVKTLIMSEDGKVVGTAQKGYDILKIRTEYAEQDMDILWKAARDTICILLEKHRGISSEIKAISYSGQMHGLVMLDKNNKLIRNTIIWADQRSQEAINTVYEKIPEEEYKNTSFNVLSTGFMLSSLMWVKEHEPENYNRIAHVMLPKDYIRYQMCGNLGTDMSDASATGIFDTAHRTWAWDFIDRLGLNRDVFVSCHESYEIAGEVSHKCAEETGLTVGTKIVCGGGDSLMQAGGNGMIGQDALSANIGTASQLACTVSDSIHDEKYRTNTFCHVRENLWMVMGANLSGGIALKWLMNQILFMDSFDEMTALAKQAPAGSDGLLFLPYLNGERTPHNDPKARGVYHGLTLNHGRAHIIRSTMEGIVFNLRASQEIMEGMGISYSKIIASGGGARGELFREIQADVLGREIYTSLVEEQACIGAAITAAVGVKTYSSYEEACKVNAKLSTSVTEPVAERQKIYQERYQVFKELYSANKGFF